MNLSNFNGWRCGLPYFGPVLAAGVLLMLLNVWLGLIVLVAGVLVMLFFRDFPRRTDCAALEVVAPADGTITHIEDLESDPYYDGPCRRVSIFLSVFSVHVNRAPFAGTIRDVRYAPGKYIDARDPECSKINESNAILMDTKYGLVTVRQISGAVARRIVCVAAAGDSVEKGQRIGMIRFGSRTELYLPPGTEVTVQIGQYVTGGVTVMARFQPGAEG
jgi:phosphatidylserine decarboxylase